MNGALFYLILPILTLIINYKNKKSTIFSFSVFFFIFKRVQWIPLTPNYTRSQSLENFQNFTNLEALIFSIWTREKEFFENGVFTAQFQESNSKHWILYFKICCLLYPLIISKNRKTRTIFFKIAKHHRFFIFFSTRYCSDFENFEKLLLFPCNPLSPKPLL